MRGAGIIHKYHRCTFDSEELLENAEDDSHRNIQSDYGHQSVRPSAYSAAFLYLFLICHIPPIFCLPQSFSSYGKLSQN